MSKAGSVFTKICCLDVEDLGLWMCRFSSTSAILGRTKDKCFLTELIRNVKTQTYLFDHYLHFRKLRILIRVGWVTGNRDISLVCLNYSD